MQVRAPSLVRGQHHARRLEFRPPSPTDAPALMEAIEASLQELRVFMPFAHGDISVEQQFDRLVGVQRDYWGEGDKVFHLWEGESLLGCFGLHRRTLNRLGYEIGYWVRSDHAGRGIGTFGTRSLALLCFDYFACERAQLLYNAANHGSQRIAEKCGFTLEGRLRHFESTPTPRMVDNGATQEAVTVMTSLIRADLPALDWVDEHRDRIEVFDWRTAAI